MYKDETYRIRGACFAIWKEFAGAFKESVIERALEKELREKGLEVERQHRIDIKYKGEKIGTYVPDLIINKKILIELKVKPYIIKEDERQFWYYLKSSEFKLGLLINFGSKNLEIRRRVYDKARLRRKSA